MILTFFETLSIIYYITGLLLITFSKTGTVGEWISYIFLAIGVFIYIGVLIAMKNTILMIIFSGIFFKLVKHIWEDVQSCEKL